MGARRPQVQEELLLHFVDGVLGMYGRTLSELVVFCLCREVRLLHLHPKEGVNPFALDQGKTKGDGETEKYDRVLDLCIRATQQAESLTWTSSLQDPGPCCHCQPQKHMPQKGPGG